ncbi:MAG: hypothetical protein DLM61_22725 [Pseudonocardiales bacterium]|nr:MAG: hypothetical protein DLM61_22725 [Pseudonocardiales bacterium]
MMRAVWNGVVLAEAPRTVRVEGNHYFPLDSLHRPRGVRQGCGRRG